MKTEIKYSKIKNAYIKIVGNNTIFVTIPEFLKGNQLFYQKILIKIEKMKQKIIGKKYQTIDKNVLFGNIIQNDQLTQQDFYNIFYEKALQYLDIYAKKMGVSYKTLGCKYLKSKWGSCSFDNKIILNLYLVHIPEKFLEYVVVHELCHIIHKNHSKYFWTEVEKYFPDYLKVRKELKTYKIEKNT